MTAITLDLRPLIDLSDEQFYQLCQANPDIRLERTANGELIVMPPTGGNTGKRNFSLIYQLGAWVEKNSELGVGFDSSTEFNLPSGGDRSPDAAWVKMERWQSLTDEEQDAFPPICPDFVIELRSRTDNLKELQDKMQEYLKSGLRLGWLIDPKNKRVEIYRQGQAMEVLQSPTTLSGEDVLPGFVLYLSQILVP
jgi:Uma2 family endonuclease